MASRELTPLECQDNVSRTRESHLVRGQTRRKRKSLDIDVCLYFKEQNNMGWASGSYLAEDLYLSIRRFISEDNRKEVATIIYEKFCNDDADDWDKDSILLKDKDGSC